MLFTYLGGKHFSRDLRPLDADGNEISMWSAGAQKKKNLDDSDEEEDSEEDSEEESSEEESDENAGPSGSAAAAAELDREARKKEKKARKEAAIAKAKAQAVQVGDLPPSGSDEDDSSSEEEKMPINPNRSKAARNQTKAPSVQAATEGMKELKVSAGGTPSRKEREAADAAAAKERYRKLHEAGKTDEAKADMARLKLIREKREAEAARKQAEKEEREALEKEKRAELDAREAKRREAAMGPKAKGKSKK
ncbi:casein kinase substrate phosphoprotein PP28-domain-containing protein [Apodospora peruviana]|uniref:Casein kinase substrate phosphoprotein PP28-domain-containing protein n=1 Tax=Apodospora peruviana TaxID=516989 RepID=A0AAE0IAN5_9PEZI|nr:casein kinase substrate phosphoprotein PP28-domain-containing protein [Apodospora peruviana]